MCPLLCWARYVVAIAFAVMDCVGGRVAQALVVIDQPEQQTGRSCPLAFPACFALARELPLHPLPQFIGNDGLMIAGIDRTAIDDLAPIEAVLEQRVERPARVGDSAGGCA